jgi:succinylglutamate desuccinylase
MKVHSNTPGIYGEIKIADEEIYKIFLHSIIGVAFSKLETQQYLSVFNTVVTNENYNFKALNYFVEPGLNFTHPFKSLSIGINLGYMIQFGKQAFYRGTDKKNTLYDLVNQVSVKPNWNGIKFGLTITYSISRTVKTTPARTSDSN